MSWVEMTRLHAQNIRQGFTIVELMVTILIVSILAATLGVFFVRLLTIQEKEREDAYIRERLVDICGKYADYLSLGSSFQQDNSGFSVTYRQETGGVSIEKGGSFSETTGRVSRVVQLTSDAHEYSSTLSKLGVNTALEFTAYTPNLATEDPTDVAEIDDFKGTLHGEDIPLIPLNELISSKSDNHAIKVTLSNTIVPISTINGGAALGCLQVSARYDYEKERADGTKYMTNTIVTVERIVRLWNCD